MVSPGEVVGAGVCGAPLASSPLLVDAIAFVLLNEQLIPRFTQRVQGGTPEHFDLLEWQASHALALRVLGRAAVSWRAT